VDGGTNKILLNILWRHCK